MKRRHDKKSKQPKKSIGDANVIPKRTKQVVNKSTGKQNIQIHIDLSKRTSKKTSPTPSSRASPIINLPPPVYGMSAPSSSSSSMIDALNLILAQNTKFENARRNETKKANIITGEKERVNQPTLADEINKNVGSLPTEEPSEGQYEEQEEEPYEEYQERESLGTLLQPKSTKRMNLVELVEYAMNRYNIEPYYEVEGKGRQTGQIIQKQKTKKQLIAEIEEKRRLASKIGF